HYMNSYLPDKNIPAYKEELLLKHNFNNNVVSFFVKYVSSNGDNISDHMLTLLPEPLNKLELMLFHFIDKNTYISERHFSCLLFEQLLLIKEICAFKTNVYNSLDDNVNMMDNINNNEINVYSEHGFDQLMTLLETIECWLQVECIANVCTRCFKNNNLCRGYGHLYEMGYQTFELKYEVFIKCDFHQTSENKSIKLRLIYDIKKYKPLFTEGYLISNSKGDSIRDDYGDQKILKTQRVTPSTKQQILKLKHLQDNINNSIFSPLAIKIENSVDVLRMIQLWNKTLALSKLGFKCSANNIITGEQLLIHCEFNELQTVINKHIDPDSSTVIMDYAREFTFDKNKDRCAICNNMVYITESMPYMIKIPINSSKNQSHAQCLQKYFEKNTNLNKDFTIKIICNAISVSKTKS
ncbi:MAG: hypothetical protein O7C58_05520, partial [Rickettsia endosymbiont of Ixodes persulcatus]|nr:hypothetical protein [Rickettsia endosymbiont of Ixodes persulcatus]